MPPLPPPAALPRSATSSWGRGQPTPSDSNDRDKLLGTWARVDARPQQPGIDRQIHGVIGPGWRAAVEIRGGGGCGRGGILLLLSRHAASLGHRRLRLRLSDGALVHVPVSSFFFSFPFLFFLFCLFHTLRLWLAPHLTDMEWIEVAPFLPFPRDPDGP